MSAALDAMKKTPRRILDSLLDPIRRRHSVSRIIESWLPAFLVIIALTWSWRAAVLGALVITLLEFLLYEWILEPIVRWTGYYWERGPRDGETFARP